MPAEISLPKLGVSMTEATLVTWVAADAAPVAAGEVICTIETDKVEQDIEAPVAGTLHHVAAEGAVYQVGELIAEID